MDKKVQVIDIDAEQIDVEQLTKELKTISIQKAILEKRDKEIKSSLTEVYFGNASRDNKGNSFYQSSNDSQLILKREARTSISLNEEKALEFFNSRGLLGVVTKRELVFLDDAIAQLVVDEEITPDELESICDKKVTFAYKFVKATELGEENAPTY